ncbi:ATP-binding protein [Sneathia vaginalis]|nr:ATP-binding protein [Sneathia vaginalis]MDK9582098.1 ATP-binding protein [Sneathia vaginalis]
MKEFSDREKVPYYIMNLNLEKFNENSAREKRYEALEKCRIENGYTYIATGHNMNDNVETVIFRLLRGTGLDGLKGIPKKEAILYDPY